jgi:flagellar biosynthetic protein FliR
MGAMLVAQQAGLAFGQIVDPTSDEQETVLGVFYVQLGLVIFLIVGGHRALVDACLGTFREIPLLAATVGLDVAVDALVRSLVLGCEVALRVAAPTMLTLILVDVAMGFVSRTMPQLNILAVGFSIKSLVAYVFLAVSLPVAASAFVAALERSQEWLSVLLSGAG